MNDISSDDIFLLKQRLAEQEVLIHALQEKLSNREREIDHLQAQLAMLLEGIDWRQPKRLLTSLTML